MLSRSILAFAAIACAAGSTPLTGARAHSVFVMPAPQVHVSAGHQSFGGFHGRAGASYARPGTRTVINGQVVFVGGYDPGMMMRNGSAEPTLDAPVPSDADRYRASTGGMLPAHHGLVVLQPTSPRGDVTYLWSSSGGN